MIRLLLATCLFLFGCAPSNIDFNVKSVHGPNHKLVQKILQKHANQKSAQIISAKYSIINRTSAFIEANGTSAFDALQIEITIASEYKTLQNILFFQHYDYDLTEFNEHLAHEIANKILEMIQQL